MRRCGLTRTAKKHGSTAFCPLANWRTTNAELRDIFAEEIALYEAHGIFGLHRLGRSNEYHTVVWLLAQRIQKILMHHRVEPRALDVRTLGTSFEEPR